VKFNGKFTIRLGFYVGFSWYSTLLEGVNSADQPLEMTCCHCWLCPRICCQIQGTPKIKKGKIHENRQKDNIFERIYWICIINVYIYRYTYIYMMVGENSSFAACRLYLIQPASCWFSSYRPLGARKVVELSGFGKCCTAVPRYVALWAMLF